LLFSALFKKNDKNIPAIKPTSTAHNTANHWIRCFSKETSAYSPIDVAPTAHLRRPLKMPPPTSTAPDGAVSVVPAFWWATSVSVSAPKTPRFRLRSFIKAPFLTNPLGAIKSSFGFYRQWIRRIFYFQSRAKSRFILF